MGFGKAQVGDKTMIDAIVPFADDLSRGRRRGPPPCGTPGSTPRPSPSRPRSRPRSWPRSWAGPGRTATRASAPPTRARCPSPSSARRWPASCRPRDEDRLTMARFVDRLQPEDVLRPPADAGVGAGGRRRSARTTRRRPAGPCSSSSSRPSRAFPAWSSWPSPPGSRSAGRTCTGRTSGPFTGEVSGAELAELGATMVEVGHAERRAMFGETDEIVARKTLAGLRNGLAPVLCIGEPEPGRAGPGGRALHRAAGVRTGARARVGERAGQLLVAYEPIWAIGAPEPAPPEYVTAVCRALREHVAGDELFPDAKVIYGGSAGPGPAAPDRRGRRRDVPRPVRARPERRPPHPRRGRPLGLTHPREEGRLEMLLPDERAALPTRRR